MKNETMTVDDIECPYCGRVFDGGEATNYDTTCDFVNCPTCDGEIEVLQSVTYTCHPVKNQDLTAKAGKGNHGRIKTLSVLRSNTRIQKRLSVHTTVYGILRK